MDFLRLPKEIIIIIVRKLDTMSVLSLYESCTYLQNLISMSNVVKTCQLSLNSLATAQSLKLSFFKNISGHLQELDMCAVSDLSKTALLPAIKKMKSLKTLNVAYTNITLLDFLDLYKACPTIKNIDINFQFDKCPKTKVANETLKSCQLIFRNLENVHFVGTYLDLLFSGLSSYILKETILNSLTYTIVEKQVTAYHNWHTNEKIIFKNMNIYILNCKNVHGHNIQSIFSMLDLGKYEFIIITVLNAELLINTQICASPKFMDFFSTLGIDTKCNLDCINLFQGNIIIMLWDKEYIKFDDFFFKTLFKQIQYYIPFNYKSCHPSVMQYNNNWFYLTPKVQLNDKKRDDVNYSPDFKKKRVVPRSVILDYDELIIEKQSLELTFSFSGAIRNPVMLSPCSLYLKKITFLSLIGPVRYSSDFFKVLFHCCVNLLTLNIEAFVISSCALAISKSIQLSKSIKHFRLMDKHMDFKTLFTSLSKCKTLENIHLHDISTECTDLADPTVLFEECKNLYHLFIFAPMAETTKTKNLRLFKKVKSKCKKNHLYVELYNHSDDVKYNYDPYVNMFKLIPIKSYTERR